MVESVVGRVDRLWFGVSMEDWCLILEVYVEEESRAGCVEMNVHVVKMDFVSAQVQYYGTYCFSVKI